MAGICGIIGNNAEFQSELVDKMLSLLRHRGNKYREIYSDRNIILGFQGEESNCYFGEDGVCLLIDGLIYNSAELRDLTSTCKENIKEIEILVSLYKKYGVEMYRNLDGDFVMLTWDKNIKKLFFAKSLANNKNIYYYQTGKFIFASEIKSLLVCPEVKKEIDPISVNNFLSFSHIPTPYTFFKNIKRANPNSVLLFDYRNNLVKENRIDSFSITDDKINSSLERETIKSLSQLLEKSIAQRIKKTKEIALFLSGGLDSSTLLYFLTRYSSKPIRTYTIGLKNDLLYARRIAKYFSTSHTELEITSEDILNILPKAIWHMEYPLAGPDAFLYLLSKISEKEKCVFWGQGAEEVFFGRNDYIFLHKLYLLKKFLPDWISEILHKEVRGISNKSFFHKCLNIFCSSNILDSYISFRENFTERERQYLLDKKYFYPNNASIERLDGLIGLEGDIVRNYSSITLKNGFLSDVFPAFSQELIDPYLDKNLMSFCYSIETKLKIKNNESRYLLKMIMKDKLPSYIIERRKDSWDSQAQQWPREKNKIFLFFIQKLKERQYIKKCIHLENYLKLDRFRIERKLWCLLSLELMHEIFIDQNYIKEPSLKIMCCASEL